jgi:hypothetical protein
MCLHMFAFIYIEFLFLRLPPAGPTTTTTTYDDDDYEVQQTTNNNSEGYDDDSVKAQDTHWYVPFCFQLLFCFY